MNEFMSLIAPIGATCLGILIGYLVGFFIRRFKEFTPGTLSSVISVILGVVVIRFLEAEIAVWWFYPMGLLIGFIAQTIVWKLEGKPLSV
jgi:hypothetical protein